MSPDNQSVPSVIILMCVTTELLLLLLIWNKKAKGCVGQWDYHDRQNVPPDRAPTANQIDDVVDG